MESHKIVLNLDPGLGGPFLCRCGLVLWDSEECINHLTVEDIKEIIAERWAS